MSLDSPQEPEGAAYALAKTVEEWIEARIKDEERGIKRLTIPDLYDHFGGDWHKTLEAFKKLEALRAMRRTDDESVDDEEGESQ